MMEEKKDIGKYLRDRLEGSEGTAPEVLWERIDESLDGKKKRKKRMFWLLFSTVGIIVVGLIYFGSVAGDTEIKTPELDTPVSEEKGSQDSEVTGKELDTVMLVSEENIEVKDSEENAEAVSTTEGSKQKTVLDSFIESETTYYYYRSSDEQKIITSDRSKVDSVINEHKNRFEETDTVTEFLN